MDERDEYEYRVRENVTEIIKLSFDNLKHLTTLNAGSIVLIATFLKDIFPGVKGTLQRYAVVLDLGLIGCLVQYRGCRGPLLILTEPK